MGTDTMTTHHPQGGDILRSGKGAKVAKCDSTEIERGRTPACKHRGTKQKYKLQDRKQMGEKMGQLS